MNTLCVVACLLGLVVMCQSQCYMKQLAVNDSNKPAKGCVDEDDQHHPFGSEWLTKECFRCYCTKDGISCCSQLFNHAMYTIPSNCEKIEDMKTCTYKVVLKSDHTKECPL